MSENEQANAELGELEAAVMTALWSLGEGDVREVQSELVWDKPLAYTTVMTILNRLVQKGYANREPAGRKYRYRPILQQEQAGRSALSQVVDRFYGGLRGRAVFELLSDRESLSDDELDEMEEIIRQQRRDRSE